MKISYNWLKQYINTNLDPNSISKILTDTGLEVDGIEKIEAVKGGLAGVVVGEVLSCEKHPDADKLKVTEVSIGTEKLQIVCGAPNVAAGQKVIVATVGCTLYPTPDEAFKIKSSKIRGVESNGMLCAEDELGLGKSHDGILVLDPSTPVGMSASSYFDLEDDYQLEIGLTPNRADAMGHIGVARDLVAAINLHENAQLTLDFPILKPITKTQDLAIDIDIQETELCPRYVGISLTNVTVKPSPAWLQKRLRAVGLSPINNIVDCTNFVMRELGTPLHAFDAERLGGKICVKLAEKGSKFTTLDGVERTLDSSNLMISNGIENLAIAGVLGGLDSGINEKTTSIFIESAYFNPVSVRKTAKMHGLNTDASFRYERGIDPNMLVFALSRVVNLIQEVAGGDVAMEITDIYPSPILNKIVDFDPIRCSKLIGHEIAESEIETIFSSLDILILEKNETWKVEVPAYRVDVLREVDLIEEVLRIYGFNRIPLPEKLNTSLTKNPKQDAEKIQLHVAELLVGMGISETLNNSLTTSAYITKFETEKIKREHAVEMLNPLSQELDVMRQSLIFGNLEVIAHNQNRQRPDLKLFEFGKTYAKFGENYVENKRLILSVTGNLHPEQWNTSKDKSNFYTIKGIVMGLLARLGLAQLVKEKSLDSSLLVDGVSLHVLKNNIGEIGWISAAMQKEFGIKNPVFIANLNWDALLDSLKFAKVVFSEIPKTFETRRDFSLLLDQTISFSQLEELARKQDKKILQHVGLFDVYEGKNLEAGKKSYALSFHFQDSEKTLKDEQVDAVMQKIQAAFEKELNAQLRS